MGYLENLIFSMDMEVVSTLPTFSWLCYYGLSLLFCSSCSLNLMDIVTWKLIVSPWKQLLSIVLLDFSKAKNLSWKWLIICKILKCMRKLEQEWEEESSFMGLQALERQLLPKQQQEKQEYLSFPVTHHNSARFMWVLDLKEWKTYSKKLKSQPLQ